MAKDQLLTLGVLRALRDSQFAPTIKVFGSAAKCSPQPNDIDIALDLKGLTPDSWGLGARHAALVLQSQLQEEYGSLLDLARIYYGRLDVFLITDSGLYVRSPRCTQWTKARNAEAITAAIQDDGVPLAQVLSHYGVKPTSSPFWNPMMDPAFSSWFGDSKAVVEATGLPRTFYHGSGADIGQAFRAGTFFTAVPDIAEIYAKAPTRQTDDAGPNISPVFLSVQNPYIFDAAVINDNISHHVLGKRGKIDDVVSKLTEAGHDGLFIKNYHDLGGVQDQYVIFRPAQVKTAVGWHCAPIQNPGLQVISKESQAGKPFAAATTASAGGSIGASVVTSTGKAGGLPMVVYHGTNAKFSTFDMAKSRDGAHFFVANESHAASFGEVKAYLLKIENPLEISQDDLDEEWDKEHPGGEQDERCLLPRDFVHLFVKRAHMLGHDGLIIRQMGDRDIQADMYLPLSPDQIQLNPDQPAPGDVRSQTQAAQDDDSALEAVDEMAEAPHG